MGNVSNKVVTKGLVLRENNTKESDKILTVLTPDCGKIPVVAKGARKQKSKFSAVAQQLVLSEMTLNKTGDWYYLVEGNTIESFEELRFDLEKLALGSYLVELVEHAVEGEEETDSILRLLLNALYALSKLSLKPELVKGAFEWRLMCEEGYAPAVEGCFACGKELPEHPVFDVQEGTLFCRECRNNAQKGIGMPLCEDSLRALRYVMDCDGKKLYSFSLSSEALHRFNNASEAFCAAQMERSFHTLDFLKSITKFANS